MPCFKASYCIAEGEDGYLKTYCNISLAVKLLKTILLLKMKEDCTENPELICKVG